MPASLVIRGGTVVDGTGAPGRVADVVIDNDRIIAVTPDAGQLNADELDATGLAVSPGFINILSHAWGSVQIDPTAGSDVIQGVTTEIFGESFSLGPSDEKLVAALRQWDDLSGEIEIQFDHLSQGLDYLQQRGVAVNVASFIGGANLRLLGAGFDDRRLTPDELDRLCALVEEDMQDGALGIGTALIYPPGRFADTDELIALSTVVGRYDGTYISHMRSEGDQFIECLDELLLIGQKAEVRTEVWHLKAAGQHNWPKMQTAIERIETARASGQIVNANMYPYTAGGTSLASCIPPRYHVGGMAALLKRLKDDSTRREIVAALREPSDDFENLFLAAGGGDGVLFFADFPDGLAGRGRRLSEVADDLGIDDASALLELVSRVPGTGAAYFIIGEDNVRLGLSQPWVSIGSDAPAHQPIEPFSSRATHPRAYGTFARVLGHYCRDEQLFSLEEAVRRMTSLPADNVGLRDRGRIVEGAFADIAVFDPATVADHATYENPHVYATGMSHVVVNGEAVLRDGKLTHATPGRSLRRER